LLVCLACLVLPMLLPVVGSILLELDCTACDCH
jgi:hypothetical protein